MGDEDKLDVRRTFWVEGIVGVKVLSCIRSKEVHLNAVCGTLNLVSAQ